MTLTLILIRHAKSDWADAGLADHDRPLNTRGIEDAPRIGGWLADQGLRPDHVLCSTATRAVDTWAAISAQMQAQDIEVSYTRALYLAMPPEMLNVIKASEGRVLAVIGHNPGIGSLARSLLASPPDHAKFTRYPTAATLVADFEAQSWADIEIGAGLPRAFITPRDLS
ncbi:histidine phosphatase family protein [Rhodobacteraceae bacterium XHP0102]|nr:histidine phosphatase family protein [Rhodobacteraceae bacterium XHP0102]